MELHGAQDLLSVHTGSTLTPNLALSMGCSESWSREDSHWPSGVKIHLEVTCFHQEPQI